MSSISKAFSTGYESSIFVVKPSEKFDCPICFNILNDPRQCLNGHLFCNGCIVDALKKNSACPLCKIELNSAILGKSLFVQNAVDDMITICPSSEVVTESQNTCQWSGPLHSRVSHYELECPNYSIKCPNEGCDFNVLRVDMQNHVENICDFTLNVCMYCTSSTQFIRSDLSSHISICCERPTVCPNDCGEMVSQRDLSQHYLTCDMEIMDCPLFTAGICTENCPKQATKREIKLHTKDCDNLLMAILSLSKTCTDLNEKVVELTSLNHALALQLVSQSETQNATIQKILSEYEYVPEVFDKKLCFSNCTN